ncbi:hypothetical protein QT970_21995 [Microcoleus sp. herbarium8]|uniref:hypothetical protein n=1 Tax=Microcoleus sp. herbarium8 TaxID=3055436 RepID=UPI002FD51C7D
MKRSYLFSGISPNVCSSAIGKNITHPNQIPTVVKGEQPVCAIRDRPQLSIGNRKSISKHSKISFIMPESRQGISQPKR